jgi:hypothetical protein
MSSSRVTRPSRRCAAARTSETICSSRTASSAGGVPRDQTGEDAGARQRELGDARRRPGHAEPRELGAEPLPPLDGVAHRPEEPARVVVGLENEVVRAEPDRVVRQLVVLVDGDHDDRCV